MAGELSVETVRLAVLDRMASDNLLDMDLSFSNEEITAAMSMAVRAFNDLPPQYLCFPEGTCPDTSYMLHGTIKYLYLAALSRLMRNRVTYEGGNSTADPDDKRIEWFSEGIKLHGAEFERGALQLKREVNTAQAWGSH